MQLVECEHPKRVYNRYLQEYIHVRCGECAACQNFRSNRWISRLETERQMHPAAMFVTLTYNDSHLPMFVPSYFPEDKSELVGIPLVNRHGEYIHFCELEFDTPADLDYYRMRMAINGIPYADFKDIQLFHKRLNKWFHDNVTQKYKNFRYFCVAELGSTTLRPHFHSIYYVDDWQVVERFSDGVLSCWSDSQGQSYGNCDVQLIEKSASAYVAQYLTKLYSVPSFYRHPLLRTKFVSSKRPPIGLSSASYEDDEKIVNDLVPYQVVRRSEMDVQPTVVPLYKAIEDRLFPRFSFYRQVPPPLRVELYSISERFGEGVKFEDYMILLWKSLTSHDDAHQHGVPIDFVDSFLLANMDGFSSRGYNFMKRLFYISRRVLRYCAEFRLTLNQYVRRIDEYWSNKELFVLKAFYLFQESFQDSIFGSAALLRMYPEYCYQASNPTSFIYVPELTDIVSYKSWLNDSKLSREKAVRSHFKNDYFQRKVECGDLNLIALSIFYYAKKCYEVAKAFQQSRQE